MFNFKAFALLIVALGFGVGAAVFANNWLQQQAAGTQIVTEEVERVRVLVAAREVPFGKRLEEIDMKFVDWPADLAPKGVIEDAGTAIGRVANQTLTEGEPLLETRVVEQLSGSTLSAMVTPTKRAITVRVNDVAGVAGFLLPGNRVDVLGTRMDKDRRARTATVLENVKVLAIDQKANPDKDEPVVVRAVTLEADLEESIKLVAATEEGTVQLVLRNPEDSDVTVPPVLAVPTVARAPRRPAAPPTVRIIRGTAVNSTVVQN